MRELTIASLITTALLIVSYQAADLARRLDTVEARVQQLEH
jgi:hypothetical protein